MTSIPSSNFGNRPNTRTIGEFSRSVVMMLAITLVLVGGIGARLAYLQLIQGSRNRKLAEDNRIRLIPTQPVRGNIFDRHGKILASSSLSHTVYLWPLAQKPEDWPATIVRLCEILNLPTEVVLERLEQIGYQSPLPIRVARRLTSAQVTALEEYGQDLKGIEVSVEAIRTYPNGSVAAHVLGYTGEIDELALEQFQEEGKEEYRLGDIVGQMGVEAAFEPQLRGEWGGRQVEVDSRGQIVRVLGEKQAQGGRDVQITLDLELQKAAEVALGNTKGAIVAIDPRNGAVLALVSRPAFDPNIFSTRISTEDWAELQSADHPFVNRALQGFPPASTFKIVTTTAAIESGEFPTETVLPTYPYITAGGIKFWDWNRVGFGPLGFAGAMAWSSDTFFYQIAQAIGETPLIQWTRRYGFGEKTGIELAAEESPGLVPDEAWKKEVIGEGWFMGDTINMSIGQGYLQASPLQVAVMFAIPANGGYRVQPHLWKDDTEASQWRESLNISQGTLDVLAQGLREVITMGTGSNINSSDIPPFAGKSGTAEAPPFESHTWFGAYGPMDNPEIVVVAFGEHSGQGGGSFTGPKVLQVLQAYFSLYGDGEVMR
ncbi:penicillin-binding protein 2 [Baaleninema simplex]|uniref:penicillin-binding protein 2 n=1 Tax=Baaleninema simplex TaxID=2862350 RepID=UPI0004754CA1|nr:penicillin-binding protein 2 [Baaleninema simplex]